MLLLKVNHQLLVNFNFNGSTKLQRQRQRQRNGCVQSLLLQPSGSDKVSTSRLTVGLSDKQGKPIIDKKDPKQCLSQSINETMTFASLVLISTTHETILT